MFLPYEKINNQILYLDRFLGSENRENYFTSVQRSRILYEILSTAVFGKKKKGEVGVERLVEEGVFSAAFPLHDVSLNPLSCALCLPYYILYRAHDVRAGMNGAPACRA